MSGALVALVIVLAFASAALTDRSSAWSRVLKVVASSLVIVLLVTVRDGWDAYSLLVLAALLASWTGDLALSFDGRAAFVTGLVAFAIAHVFYIAAFVARDGFDLAWFAAGAVLMTVVGVAVLRWLAPHRPDELRLPLTVYVVIIGLMVAAAFATHGADPDIRIPIAAILFAASDILVARQRFVTRTVSNRLVGLPAYFLAQLLFALSTGGTSIAP